MPYFPNTLFTANTSTMDIIIEKFPYNLSNISYYQSENFSRLALELYVVHGSNTSNGSVSSLQSIDDEYTPSVFTTNTYKTDASEKDDAIEETGFFQWKPISYQSPGRTTTNSQQVNVVYTAGHEFCDTMNIPGGLVRDVFGDSASNVTRWFVVFGNSGDITYFNSVRLKPDSQYM